MSDYRDPSAYTRGNELVELADIYAGDDVRARAIYYVGVALVNELADLRLLIADVMGVNPAGEDEETS